MTVTTETAKNGMTAESEFTYTPPMAGQEGEQSLDDLARSAIDDIQAEFDAANVLKGDETGEEPVGSARERARARAKSLEEQAVAARTAAEAEPDDEAEAAPEAEAEADPAADDADDAIDPKVARTFERVVQREMAAKEQETKTSARIAELDVKIKEFQALSGLRQTKDLMEMAASDPVGAMKALGQDPISMTKLALAQQLGDKAPQDLQDFARNFARDREVRDLRAQIAQSEQTRAHQEYFNSVANGAREYVSKSVGDSTPTFATVAKANPERAHKEIMEEILKDASTRGASDPSGEPLSYPEAAKRVEARFTEWVGLLGVQNSMTAATSKSTQKPNVTAPPQPKPPARPIRPWEQKNNLEEQGLQEAMREFHKLEAAAKAQRR